AEVVAKLHPDVRPQDDLFLYVNGLSLDGKEIPADQSSTGSFIDLRNESERRVRAIIEDLAESGSEDLEATKIGALFNSFMDEARLNGLGVGPLAQDFALINDAADKASLAVSVGKLQHTGVGAFYSVDVDADRNNPNEYILWAFQSGLGLPDEAYYRSEDYAEILSAYKEFIPTLYALGTEVSAEEAVAAAETIVDFETKLAASHFDVVTLRDAEKTNTVATWDEFISSAPGYQWAESLAVLGFNAENAAKILVYTPGALTGFAKLWEETDLEVLKTYLRWHTIIARAPFLSSEVVQANFNFYNRTLLGQEEQRDRWKRGVAVVDSMLGEAVGKQYVQRHFPPEYKAKMEQLVADLLAAYKTSIENLDWMTPATKEKALAKLATFVTKIGYPNKWRDYNALEIDADDLVGNIRRGAEFSWLRQVEKLGKPVDRDEWYMYPQTVNAYYNPVANEIVFPAAILEPPFFDPEADMAWNYGGIGAVIGHEIGHGFDDQGSKYDGEGYLNNWWTDEDRTEFEKRTAALIAQYDAYVPAQFPADSPHHVQGALTLGENIGDLGGLSIALKAYEIAVQREGYASSSEVPVIEGFTGVQRLFLSWARIWEEKRRDELMIQRIATDPHSPCEFRCNGVVKNVDAFAEAFELTENDALYLPPAERVRIW
ncbi:MAG: M13-type metalloendopeptidase, partial [Arcanobacterium sp.]|nr:M13-type metalloendopeptidase [Arcanobacterium sp.]